MSAFHPLRSFHKTDKSSTMRAEPEQAESPIKQAAKGFALAAWMAFSFLLWGGLTLAIWLGLGTAEPPPPEADRTSIYVLYAVIALAFVVWLRREAHFEGNARPRFGWHCWSHRCGSLAPHVAMSAFHPKRTLVRWTIFERGQGAGRALWSRCECVQARAAAAHQRGKSTRRCGMRRCGNPARSAAPS